MRIVLAVLLLGVASRFCSCPPLTAAAQQKDQPKGQAAEIKDGILKIEGQLTKDDPKDRVRQNSAHKVHQVKLAAGKSYSFDLVSKDFDSFLRLEDAAGTELAKDDDGGGELNARIVFKPSQDGNYRIIATTFAGGTGKYTLTVRDTKDTTITAEFKDGVFRVQGQLNNKDQELRGRHYKTYVIKLAAGKAYTIDLESSDFDAFLRLESPEGKTLAQDDDGGEDLNARIMFNAAKEGTYRIIVTTFDQGETGSYTFSVRQK